jgi:hypothetical protein
VGQLVLLCALLGLVVLLGLAIRRGTELFSVTIEAGVPQLDRGRCPSRLFDELADVARLERLDGVRVSVVTSGGMPHLRTEGNVSEGQAQQLRNVVGSFQVAQIRRGNKRA